MLHIRHRLLGSVLLASVALLLAGAMLQPASASSAEWLSVRLGNHRFGHLSKPEGIVAKAGPEDVGFWLPESGEGIPFGPWSFEVAQDGSVWLMDELNDRLLVWSPDRPDRPARIVPLPLPAPVDFALGRRGMIYVFSSPPGERGYLYAMTADGKVRWKARTIVEVFNSQLRMGPDGTLYYRSLDELGWVPVVTPAGRPVPLAEQRRRASPFQPMPGGLRLATADVSGHKKDFSLIDQAGHVVRAWRVTSQTTLWFGPATAALLGRDLVVAVDVTRETETKFLYEHLILRLGSAGGTRARLALDPHVISGLDVPITELRVGPDGRLYQLRSDPTKGVSIAGYSLDPPQGAGPTPTPSKAAPPSSAPSVSQPIVAVPTAAPTARLLPTAAPPASMPLSLQHTPPASEPGGRRSMLPLAAMGVAALLALGGWLLYRRRHPSGLRRRPQTGVSL
jgi:hypothetical protein